MPATKSNEKSKNCRLQPPNLKLGMLREQLLNAHRFVSHYVLYARP
jgi:hypothetical protein